MQKQAKIASLPRHAYSELKDKNITFKEWQLKWNYKITQKKLQQLNPQGQRITRINN